jgi:hypothetical protein
MTVTYMGLTRSHQKWAAFCGVSEQTMRWRLAHWPVEKALSTGKVEPHDGRTPRRATRKSITPDQTAAMLRLYFERDSGHHSEDSIAALFDISRRTLSNILKDVGVKTGGTRPIRITEAVRVIAAKVAAKARSVSITIEASA